MADTAIGPSDRLSQTVYKCVCLSVSEELKQPPILVTSLPVRQLDHRLDHQYLLHHCQYGNWTTGWTIQVSNTVRSKIYLRLQNVQI